MGITARTWVDNTIATAAQLNTIRDDIIYLNGQIASEFYLSAQGGIVPDTSGCAAAVQSEFATNDVNLISCAFDGTAVEALGWSHPMPSDYGGGTVTAKFYWYCSNASSNSAFWLLQAVAYADGDAIDVPYGTALGSVDANNANEDMNISAATAAITIAGSPVAGEMVVWRVYRDPTHVNDDLDAIDAKLLWVKITYTRT